VFPQLFQIDAALVMAPLMVESEEERPMVEAADVVMLGK